MASGGAAAAAGAVDKIFSFKVRGAMCAPREIPAASPACSETPCCALVPPRLPLPRTLCSQIDDLCAATFTPYTESGEVDCSLVDAHCADLAEHKVPFAFINGTTGDSMSLSVPERKALAEAWVAAGAKYGVKIVNHIGTASIAESKELAAHAQAVGCVAISAMPCYFFKSNDAKAVARWLQEVGAAAPDMPLYYYHFNVMTGVFVDPLALIKACEEIGVPTFRGFKFTDFNLW